MASRTAEGRNQIKATGIRKLNTKLQEKDGAFSVTLYNTEVYREENGVLTLNNGGWVTPTTVSRMNQALDHRGIEGGVSIMKREMYFRGIKFVNGLVSVKLLLGVFMTARLVMSMPFAADLPLYEAPALTCPVEVR